MTGALERRDKPVPADRERFLAACQAVVDACLVIAMDRPSEVSSSAMIRSIVEFMRGSSAAMTPTSGNRSAEA
ncbi:MAG TPA: hypothetical protein VE650_21670 [Acetobacteraceae bacterium]|nr:hypothetical protein [Acetobacteraceae bacterium]